MDENIKKIIPFIKPYKFHVIWNVIYNILYALFSTLSFVALIPMMEKKKKNENKVLEEPIYTTIWDIGTYGKNYLYFQINTLSKNDGPQFALILVVSLVIITF